MYIDKEIGDYLTFDDARPITKTSPFYKLLDLTLANQLKKELLNADNRFKLKEIKQDLEKN